MNKLFKILLLSIIGICFNQNNLQAKEQDKLISKIESKYTFNYKKNHIGLFVLENGYTLYFSDKKDKWDIGDTLIIKKPYPQDEDDLDTEEFVRVINKTQGKKRSLLRFGWCDKNKYVISSISHQEDDGEEIIFLTLDNDVILKISYYDEKAYAKSWKKGDRVIVIINTFDDLDTFNDPNGYSCPLFSSSTYHPNWDYEVVNLDALSFPIASADLIL